MSAGSEEHPLRVAIVGSGPSGFYAAERLLKSGRMVRVDMFERLPAPFGLVRHGVAPDHPKLKEPIRIYDRIARVPEFSPARTCREATRQPSSSAGTTRTPTTGTASSISARKWPSSSARGTSP